MLKVLGGENANLRAFAEHYGQQILEVIKLKDDTIDVVKVESQSQNLNPDSGLLTLINLALASGIDIFAYLIGVGYRRIAICAEREVAVMLYHIAYMQGHFVDVYSHKKEVVEAYYNNGFKVQSVKINSYEEISLLKKNTGILVFDRHVILKEYVRDGLQIGIYDGSKLLSELLCERTYIAPLVEYSKYHPYNKILIISDFGLTKDDPNNTEHEKSILTGINYPKYVCKHYSDEGFSDPVWLERGKNIDYLREIGIYKRIRSINGIEKLANISESNINVSNNFRLTTDMPEHTNNTIWMLGSSKIVGSYVSDRETISSNLQRILNENQRHYEVRNSGGHSSVFDEQSLRMLKTLPVIDGDIVIIMLNQRKNFNILKDHFMYCDLADTFKRPHDYGELFYDKGHVSFKGNEILAKKIFERMNELDIFAPTNGAKDRDSIHDYDSLGIVTKGDFGFNVNELEELNKYVANLRKIKADIGAVVVNCNPFTLGHRYLIESSAAKVKHVYVFVVEEDKSFFPFVDRLELVKLGIEDLDNVTVLPSGQFIISQRTFPAYSEKEELQNEIIDPSMDVTLFAEKIAPALNISVRFAGEEPLDAVTRQYNSAMRRILPLYNIGFEVIQRKESEGEVISASRVRKLLKEKKFDEISKIVPKTTYDYLVSKFS